MHNYGSGVNNILQCHKDGYMHLLLARLHEAELISGILIKPSLSHLENVGVARRVNTAEGHIFFYFKHTRQSGAHAQAMPSQGRAYRGDGDQVSSNAL